MMVLASLLILLVLATTAHGMLQSWLASWPHIYCSCIWLLFWGYRISWISAHWKLLSLEMQGFGWTGTCMKHSTTRSVPCTVYDQWSWLNSWSRQFFQPETETEAIFGKVCSSLLCSSCASSRNNWPGRHPNPMAPLIRPAASPARPMGIAQVQQWSRRLILPLLWRIGTTTKWWLVRSRGPPCRGSTKITTGLAAMNLITTKPLARWISTVHPHFAGRSSLLSL